MATSPNQYGELSTTSTEQIEEFPDEPQNEARTFEFVKEKVSEQDIFKLAKSILLFVAIIFLVIAVRTG